MSEIEFTPGSRVRVISGRYIGRIGEYVKSCSVVFKDHCRVKLDLKGRERECKVIMIEKSAIENE